MFASIDGIYKDTERGAVRALMPGRNKIERDIVSWSGDLQQAVSKIYKAIHHPADGKSQLTYSAFDEESNQKMNLIFKNEYDCSEDDILADIDAMNIVKMYLDNDKMSLSDSLNAYYWFVSNNKTFRYQTFIKTVIIDEEKKENVDNKTSLERFEIEVCSQFDVKKTGSNYIEYDYYGDSNEWRFKFMLDENGKLIDSRIRIFVVKSFIEYIEANMWD